ncbi:hypothetical protein R3P38DRAFT_3252197 [Favolaschia claudopus]|uniref:Proteophosphoglycan ppg4 n=1 Tax=Favolaschia claudopus TaxID=2862362 RepID=A0AAW0E9C9_9AGAR
MDKPSWNDTLRATFSSCLTCLPCAHPTPTTSSDSDDDEYAASNSVRGVRRARPDELEGLLADAHSSHSSSGDEGWRDADAAADGDAISLHSHLGPRGRRRVPPRTPKHISLWGFNLFGSGVRRGGVALEGADDALSRPRQPPSQGQSQGQGQGQAQEQPTRSTKRSRKREHGRSTDDLLARVALDPAPMPLSDADVVRRARASSSASLLPPSSQSPSSADTEDPDERRARRKARKEMRRLAAALAEAPHTPDSADFAGFGALPEQQQHRGIPPPFLNIASPRVFDENDVPQPPSALETLRASNDAALADLRFNAEEADEADLDGVVYARLAPRSGAGGGSRSSGRSSNSGSGMGGQMPYSPIGGAHPDSTTLPPKKSKSKRDKSSRTSKSKSSATSSTLASLSPPPSATRGSFVAAKHRDSEEFVKQQEEFGTFAHAHAEEEEFDGTPGGFSFGDVEEVRVVREALPSPGLSRANSNSGGGGGFGAGMGGF